MVHTHNSQPVNEDKEIIKVYLVYYYVLMSRGKKEKWLLLCI